jgi:hypothetical protein
MYELLILLCTTWGHCQEVRMQVMSCQLAGQPAIVALCEERPGYYPARWSCREPREPQHVEQVR